MPRIKVLIKMCADLFDGTNESMLSIGHGFIYSVFLSLFMPLKKKVETECPYVFRTLCPSCLQYTNHHALHLIFLVIAFGVIVSDLCVSSSPRVNQ